MGEVDTLDDEFGSITIYTRPDGSNKVVYSRGYDRNLHRVATEVLRSALERKLGDSPQTED